MEIVYHPICRGHDTGSHPESEKRLGSLDLSGCIEPKSGERHLGLAHSKEYISQVKGAATSLDADTPVSKNSYEAACYAVGGAITAAEQGAFSAMRPPGHHAPFGGFCLFNSMAVAAKWLKRRVAIIDIDVHHGNGTQHIVKGDGSILYISTHQSPLYPGTGLVSEGNAINIPLPAGIGDKEYISIIDKEIAPALREFGPEAIGISAGFDAYYKDCGWVVARNLMLTTRSYGHLCKAVGDCPTFCVLEGGYNPESVKDGVECILKYFK